MFNIEKKKKEKKLDIYVYKYKDDCIFKVFKGLL